MKLGMVDALPGGLDLEELHAGGEPASRRGARCPGGVVRRDGRRHRLGQAVRGGRPVSCRADLLFHRLLSRPAGEAYFAGWVRELRKAVDTRLVAVGGMRRTETMNALLELRRRRLHRAGPPLHPGAGPGRSRIAAGGRGQGGLHLRQHLPDATRATTRCAAGGLRGGAWPSTPPTASPAAFAGDRGASKGGCYGRRVDGGGRDRHAGRAGRGFQLPPPRPPADDEVLVVEVRCAGVANWDEDSQDRRLGRGHDLADGARG